MIVKLKCHRWLLSTINHWHFYDLFLIAQMAQMSNITKYTLSIQCVTLNLWLILLDRIKFTWNDKIKILSYKIRSFSFFAWEICTHISIFLNEISQWNRCFLSLYQLDFISSHSENKRTFSVHLNPILCFRFSVFTFPTHSRLLLFFPFRNDHRQIILIFRHCFHCAHRFVYYARVCEYVHCAHICVLWRDGYFPIRWISMLLMVAFYRISVHTSNPVYVTYLCNFE